MNIVVFDTETTSLDKPFCYNIGYAIFSENGDKLLEKDFVVEQIWHNIPLFSSAYYADKRPIYVKAMKARKTIMNKFGYICREMARDFKNYEISVAYAYNSSFDERVFEFNCDWFKCINPFDNVNVIDIRGNVHKYLINDEYKTFCNSHNFYTESGCYSSTAENIYRFITNDIEWNEDHTALSDSLIEGEILFQTIKKGAELGESYPARRSLGRPHIKKTLVITDKTEKGNNTYTFNYEEIRINKDKTQIILK